MDLIGNKDTLFPSYLKSPFDIQKRYTSLVYNTTIGLAILNFPITGGLRPDSDDMYMSCFWFLFPPFVRQISKQEIILYYKEDKIQFYINYSTTTTIYRKGYRKEFFFQFCLIIVVM